MQYALPRALVLPFCVASVAFLIFAPSVVWVSGYQPFRSDYMLSPGATALLAEGLSPDTPGIISATQTVTTTHEAIRGGPEPSLGELDERVDRLEMRFDAIQVIVAVAALLVTVSVAVAGLIAGVNLTFLRHLREEKREARDAVEAFARDVKDEADVVRGQIKEAAGEVARREREVDRLHGRYMEGLQMFVRDTEHNVSLVNWILAALDLLARGVDLSDADVPAAATAIETARATALGLGHRANLLSADLTRKRSALFYFTIHGTDEELRIIERMAGDADECDEIRDIAKRASRAIRTRRDQAEFAGSD